MVAALAIVSTHHASAQEQGDPALDAQLGPIVEAGIRGRSVLHNARVGISIIDVASGHELYSRDATGSYNAASNTKIMTTAAALALLGPDYRYRTTVYAQKQSKAGVVKGDLYLVGRGDPSLDANALRALADELVLAGVERVTGGLVVDDTYFDADTMPPHFDEQPDEQAAFRAPVAAVSLNFNAVTVMVRPGARAGSPARVTVVPDNDYVKIISNVTTSRSGRTRVHLKTTATRDHLEVRVVGRIRTNARRRRFRRRIADPLRFTGSAFQKVLSKRGIRLGRKTLRRGPVPPQAVQLASRKSAPMAVLLRGLGKYSNNFVAEMVFKTIGAESLQSPAPATWADAQAAVRELLVDQMGLDAASFRVDNGSGLFDSNALTPRQITTVLRAAYRDFRYGPDLVATLAFAGADGTLTKRMLEGPAERQVRAKTGTLAAASALSGYVAVDGVQPLAFSILLNDIPQQRGSLRNARALQDEIAEALVLVLRARASGQ